MRLIDADTLPREKMLAARGNGQYEDVDIVYGDDIDNAPTAIHLCEVCKNRHNTWDSETCDGCTGRDCNFNPIDPVRQPHAMWINQDVRHMGPVVDLQAAECSACGRWLTTPYLYSFKHYEYCPYCGAKMDRGDEYETD